jgi:hypothetical protein
MYNLNDNRNDIPDYGRPMTEEDTGNYDNRTLARRAFDARSFNF